MNPIEEHIAAINAKLQVLVKKYTVLQKENSVLIQEVTKLRGMEKDLKKTNEILEMQINILKSSSEKLSGKDKIDFEKKINHYIRDIDKCISMLKN
jgi:uncharacterized coiled-coil DUF342 family protein